MSPPTWAYQVENFDPPPHDELICSICQCVFCEPVECSCRHVFCTACIQKWVSSHRNCPICRKRASESTLRPVNRIIKNLIMGLTLMCNNASNGCEERMKLDHCEAHMKICGYEMEDCTNGCGKMILRKDTVKHNQEDCPFRRIKCNECGLTIEGSPTDHNCIELLQQAIQEKEKENNELKEELRILQVKLNEKSKPSNIFGSSIEIDSFWSSCTSDSDSSLCSLSSSSSSSSTSSEPDLSPDLIVESSESFAVPDPEPFEQNQDYHVSPSPGSSSGHNNELQESLDFIDISSPTHFSEPGLSSGDDSINISRPRKRRLRIDSSDSNTSAGNFSGDAAGARKSQRPNDASVILIDNSSALNDFLYNDQTINLDSSSASTSCTYGSPAKRTSVSKQRTRKAVHSVNETTSQPSTSRYRSEPSTNSREKVQNGVGTSSSAQNEENEASSSVVQIFRRTLSLLRQHNIDSDSEWVPGVEDSSDSEYIPPVDINSDSERSVARSHSSSDEEEDPPPSCTDTESSYEVEVPTPTYDLLQRSLTTDPYIPPVQSAVTWDLLSAIMAFDEPFSLYCDFGDTDSDPDWSP